MRIQSLARRKCVFSLNCNTRKNNFQLIHCVCSQREKEQPLSFLCRGLNLHPQTMEEGKNSTSIAPRTTALLGGTAVTKQRIAELIAISSSDQLPAQITALQTLADCYSEGACVEKDAKAAARYWTIAAEFGDAAINRASTTWRGLTEAEKATDPKTLLATYPTLMKRPVIEHNGAWTIGWKPDVQTKYLGD